MQKIKVKFAYDDHKRPYHPVKAKMEGPTWQSVVQRIMEKAQAHKEAGRVGYFTQVFVPKTDYELLHSHFGFEPFVSTCIGLIPVYPINPDGATFAD